MRVAESELVGAREATRSGPARIPSERADIEVLARSAGLLCDLVRSDGVAITRELNEAVATMRLSIARAIQHRDQRARRAVAKVRRTIRLSDDDLAQLEEDRRGLGLYPTVEQYVRARLRIARR